MSAMSRNKGANGEREVITLLSNHLGMEFARNLKQYQEAQHGDIEAEEAFPFTIECKRYRSGWTCAPAWECQAYDAAQITGKYPCVAYRFDRQDWRFRVWFDALGEAFSGLSAVSNQRADLDINGFAYVCREIMAHRSEVRG